MPLSLPSAYSSTSSFTSRSLEPSLFVPVFPLHASLFLKPLTLSGLLFLSLAPCPSSTWLRSFPRGSDSPLGYASVTFSRQGNYASEAYPTAHASLGPLFRRAAPSPARTTCHATSSLGDIYIYIYIYNTCIYLRVYIYI